MDQNDRAKTDKMLKKSDVSHLSKMTGFTPENVRKWHASFLKDCPSGKLDKTEFNEVFKQFYPTGRVEKFFKYIFRMFDTDASGDIDFGEFLIAVSSVTQKNVKKRLTWAFSYYDINRDGFIDKKEMRMIMNAVYDLLGEEKSGLNSPTIKVDQIFSIMDTDGDQKLSKNEFISGCLRDDHLRRLLAPASF